MSDPLDVATSLLNVVAGHALPDEPPGFATLAAPRRAARGREKDVLFLCLGLRSRAAVLPERYAELLDLAAATYFGSPGSVTAALRQALAAVNQSLLQANLRESTQAAGGAPMQGGLVCAALRGADFYAVQSGPGLLLVARESGVERFPSAPSRPLGLGNTLEIHYYHATVREGEYFSFSNAPARGWSDIALVGLGHLSTLTGVADRLQETANGDFTALVGRFEAVGSVIPLQPVRSAGPVRSTSPPEAASSAALSDALPPGTRRAGTSAALRAATPRRRAGHSASLRAGLSALLRRGARVVRPVEAPQLDPSAALRATLEPAAELAVQPTAPEGLPARVEDAQHQGEHVAPERPDSVPQAAESISSYPISATADTVAEAPATEAEANTDWQALLRRAERLAPPDGEPIGWPSDAVAPAIQRGEGAMASMEEPLLSFPPAPASGSPALETRVAEPAGRPSLLEAAAGGVRRSLQSLARALGVTLAEAMRGMRLLIGRMLPEGVLQKDGLFAVPTSVQIGIALVVPLVVVGVSVWVYLERGRAEQFSTLLEQAQWQVGRGRAAPDALSARPHWEEALGWLAQAEALRPGEANVAELRQEAQARLDELDWVTRLDYQPLIVGGLGRGAQIRRIQLAGQDVYALDGARNRIFRLTPALAAPAGRYTVDESFQCAGGQAVGELNIGELIDMTLIPGPNLLESDAVVAFDTTGGLLYCAPGADVRPLASYLATPDTSWIRPTALEVYADRLYVLDPGSNEIWQYQASGGAFTEAPTHYFTSVAYDLSDVIEFSIAGGDVFLLRKDGRVAHCTRPAAGEAATCTEVVQFTDPRPGRTSGERLADVTTAGLLVYDPPPEPSLYLLDTSTAAVYQLSLKLALVGQFRPHFPFPAPATSAAVDAAKRLFVSAGDNVYVGARP